MPGKAYHQAILAKAYNTIERLLSRLNELDEDSFPTRESCQAAKNVLWDSLIAVKESISPATDSVVLEERLRDAARLVGYLEQSNSREIPWPVMSSGNRIWKSLFPSQAIQIFYSHKAKQNYEILPFTDKIESFLRGLLDEPHILRLVGESNIHCLFLPTSEQDNLPSYANIAHEFGHPLVLAREEDLRRLLRDSLHELMERIKDDAPESDDGRRSVKIFQLVLQKMCVEVFCDLLAVRVLGPAFLLSLQELTVRTNPAQWRVMLPSIEPYNCHPSYNIRLRILLNVKGVREFLDGIGNLKKKLKKMKNKDLQNVDSFSKEILTTTDDDPFFDVRPEFDIDKVRIRKWCYENRKDIENALFDFARRTESFLAGEFPGFSVPDIDDVAELMVRLESSVPPNIVPKKNDLLGRPASFSTILNASAWFRISLLLAAPTDIPNLRERLVLAERLTAKAIEVTFVQEKFVEFTGD